MFKRQLRVLLVFSIIAAIALLLVGCGASPAPQQGSSTEALIVLAVEPFLADIAQNVAGDRVTVDALIPDGIDPHSFEPSPADIAKIAASRALIINGAGFEEFLEKTLENAGGERLVIEASAGLASRSVGEETDDELADEHGQESDPHFWLDPNHVIRYVENIRSGLSQVDPDGVDEYTANAEAYTKRLVELDAWIVEQVSQIPPERRLLVTNHESFGYFADRYGFQVIGAVIPSVSTGASPSAREMAALVDQIQASGAPAIFMETGANPRLAQQIAQETGIRIAPELYSHSTSGLEGDAPGYIEMMEYNTRVIVEALNEQ